MPSICMCPFCDTNFTTHRMISHIVNRHRDKLNQKFNQDTIKHAATYNKRMLIFLDEDGNQDIELYACLGCNTSFKSETHCDAHFNINPSHDKLHKDGLQKLLQSNQAPEDNSEAVKKLKADVKKLTDDLAKMTSKYETSLARQNAALDSNIASESCMYAAVDALRTWGILPSEWNTDAFCNLWNAVLDIHTNETQVNDELIAAARKLRPSDYTNQ